MYIFPGLKWIVENHAPQIRPLLVQEKCHQIALHLMIGDLSDTSLIFPRYGAVNKNTKAGARYAENRAPKIAESVVFGGLCVLMGIHMLGILLMLASILQMLLLSTGKLMDFLLSPSDMIWYGEIA
jgi:hypothetical protein